MHLVHPMTECELEADRPAHEDKEIEVTPEMIEAAIPIVFEYDPAFSNESGVCERIFRAMMSARKGLAPCL